MKSNKKRNWMLGKVVLQQQMTQEIAMAQWWIERKRNPGLQRRLGT